MTFNDLLRGKAEAMYVKGLSITQQPGFSPTLLVVI